MENKRYVYVMLSSTGTKMGKAIKFATRARYNHASISFTENMDTLYSFGRIHHCMPFIGGLVHETFDRFACRPANKVDVKVFKIAVTEESWRKGFDRVAEIAADDEYTYNLISAATFCVKHGTAHYKTFTCSEFVSHILRIVAPELASKKPDCKVVPDDFSALLEGLEFYEGKLSEFDRFLESENPDYFKKFSLRKRVRMTTSYVKNRYWHYVPQTEEE